MIFDARMLIAGALMLLPATVGHGQECYSPDIPTSFACSGLAAEQESIDVTAITCPATPIPNGKPVSGTLTALTDCSTTINTNLGPLPVVGDVYSVDTYRDTVIQVTLDTPTFSDYFGLPYIVIIDFNGNPVAAKLGTTARAGGGYRAVMDFTVPQTGRWRFLVTGVGGPFTSPAGTYTVTAQYVQRVSKRRSSRHP